MIIHALSSLKYIDDNGTSYILKEVSIHQKPQLCSALRNFSYGCDVRCHGSGSISESTTTRINLRCAGIFSILHVQFMGTYRKRNKSDRLLADYGLGTQSQRILKQMQTNTHIYKYAQYSSLKDLKA